MDLADEHSGFEPPDEANEPTILDPPAGSPARGQYMTEDPDTRAPVSHNPEITETEKPCVSVTKNNAYEASVRELGIKRVDQPGVAFWAVLLLVLFRSLRHLNPFGSEPEYPPRILTKRASVL